VRGTGGENNYLSEVWRVVDTLQERKDQSKMAIRGKGGKKSEEKGRIPSRWRGIYT